MTSKNGAAAPHLTATNHWIPSASIQATSLHRHRPAFLHLHFLPFAFIVYPVIFYFYSAGYFESSELLFVTCISAVGLNALIWLIGEWSVTFKTFAETDTVKDPFKADVIRVIPVKTRGSGTLCKLIKEKSSEGDRISFYFQKRKYLFNHDLGLFHKLVYPVSPLPHGASETPMIVSDYINTNGLMNVDQVRNTFGKNEFEVPVPSFTELMREHAVAPFFVFQVFCVALWSLDEYWYYSGFTLLMLFAFESALVQQRLRTLKEFQAMSLKPYSIWVYRSSQWVQTMTDDLLPGDVCSISDTDDEHPVPADFVIVKGTCILNESMLSGESTPLHKEAITSLPDMNSTIDIQANKRNLLYGGTKVLQVYPTTGTGDNPEVDKLDDLCTIPTPPDKGAICYVLRTGFGTSQGGLVRLMIFSSSRVTAANTESLLFILFLLMFAIVASAYVLYHGLYDEMRSKGKLALDCMLIITSVVPPELPMELSMAVNTSLVKLVKDGIYCTEPFRIPFAGKLTTCCYDKTGTITSDKLQVEGVVTPKGLQECTVNGRGEQISAVPLSDAPYSLDLYTILTMACCQGLIKLHQPNKKPELAGDPMETATFQFLHWDVVGKDTIAPITPDKNSGVRPAAPEIESAKIDKRFHFSSALKRMTTVSTVRGSGFKGRFVAVKGAPEIVRQMLDHPIANYDDTYKRFAREGSRVIALACKKLSDSHERTLPSREVIESDLHFAGFLVLGCPLKEDSKEAINELQESAHSVVMITGDNPLTACHVAREVGITRRQALILDIWEDDKTRTPSWRTMDEKERFEADNDLVAAGFDLCVTGKALEVYNKENWFLDMLSMVHVWARVSPIQKEFILTQLKHQGNVTMMCGDGTNDVGALKQADVGVAVLDGNKSDLEKIALNEKLKRVKEMYNKQKDVSTKLGLPEPPLPPILKKLEDKKKERKEGAIASSGSDVGTAHGTSAEAKRRWKEQKYNEKMSGILDTLTEMEEDGSVPVLKFGDASIAAPFTSKLGSLTNVNAIIKQGRCTLVTTQQMYKILALNCLITAYSLSVLYLDGIKWGDWQMTVQGMLIGICFLFISRGKPLDQLSRERPLANIFNAYTLLSVLGQFAIHVMCLLFVTYQAKRNMAETLAFDYTGEKTFSPNLLNSGIYLLSLTMQCCTFAVNYQGRPFRENISENPVLYRGLVAVGGLSFLCSLELYPMVNEWLQLVPFPSNYGMRLTGAMLFDWIGCFGIERGLKWFLLGR